MDLKDIIEKLKNSWSHPSEAIHRGKRSPFLLQCSFSPALDTVRYPQLNNTKIPDDLAELWKGYSSANLFEDSQYGQWGLELLSADQCNKETIAFRNDRRDDFIEGDLIIGKFLGDADLLMIRCDKSKNDFGAIIVVLPIDIRSDWYFVSSSLFEFLESYAAEQGDKYWQP